MTRWQVVAPAAVAVVVVLGWALRRRRDRRRLAFARLLLRQVRAAVDDQIATLAHGWGSDLLQAAQDGTSVLDGRADELAREPDDRPGLLAALTDLHGRFRHVRSALEVLHRMERNHASAHERVQRLGSPGLEERCRAADGRREAMLEELRSAGVDATTERRLDALDGEFLGICVDADLATGQAFDDWAADARRRAAAAEPRDRRQPPAARDDDVGQQEWIWPE
ncbi:MAG: hypothetical protein ACKVZ6_23910 [Kineosporiaceae bacterium]